MELPRIGFITGRQLIQRDGTYYADPGVARVVNLLDERYPGLLMASTASEPTNLLTEAVAIAPDRLLFMPEMTSIIRGTLNTRACAKVVKSVEEQCDIVVVQLAIQAPLALLPVRRPRMYHVFGDIVGMTKGSTQYRGIQRLPMMALGYGLDRLHHRLINRPDARVVTNGEALFRHYGGRGDWVVSSTLSRTEIASVHRKRPPGAPVRILYVGYLRTEKGLDTLLAAWPAIRAHFTDAELRIVGPGSPDNLGPESARRLREATQHDNVVLCGSVQFGPELFQEYADADVLVLPSRSEGTPRVLIEARAFGCPVITTPVGGIPSSVDDGVDGILIQPDDPPAVSDAVITLLDDAELTGALREGGLRRAQASTVESFVEALADQIDLMAIDLGFDQSSAVTTVESRNS